MHRAVLLNEVIEHLDLHAGYVVLDATFGGGGHAEAILKKILPGGRLVAADKDPEAMERAGEILTSFGDAITFVNKDFRKIKEILDICGIESINGVVFDLGVSSFQIDKEERGFSFLKDGPLDMRLDTRQDLSAKDVVNTFSKAELGEIIKEYGEERYARLLAARICSFRKKKKIETTGELVSVIKDAVGRKYRSQRMHPACRTFQALRIYVNDELEALRQGVKDAIEMLDTGGRICVISFHSLEDRIVKNIFRDEAKKGTLKVVTKKPIRPLNEEVAENPRSRSAKLRTSEKV